MKHLKLFETYDEYNIDDIYNWWSGIKVSEDDTYYIIDLTDTYLTNKIIQLNSALKNKIVKFYCKNNMKYEEIKIHNVRLSANNELLFSSPYLYGDRNNYLYAVDLSRLIKISKLHIAANKYNL